MNYTKHHILTHSLELFNQNGFVNVRLQHIADALGISVGHLAYHFKNKETIIECLYDEIKKQQEVLLFDFRTAHLFEDIHVQIKSIFRLQKKYLFFYLDTLELLRAYPSIKEKHKQHILWQQQQIEWIFEFNCFRGVFIEHAHENQTKKFAWLFWSIVDNWMHARLLSGLDNLNEDDFLHDVWNLLLPYFTVDGNQEFARLYANSTAQS